MSGTGCKYCGCQIVEKDAARGDTVCTNCGAVLEENAIVSEVQFQETGSGGHSVIGQFVNPDMPTKLNIGGLSTVSDSRQSREVLLQNARRQILEVSGQLKLNQHCVEMALNFYKMALARNLTRGRRKTHTIAACLYITCRLEGTAHFLLDFSDALQVNVFELGRVYNFLARNLYITLPPNDPCVYVMRFANSLEFGDKEHEVSMVALRLVQRMKRDWMSIGRRPTGLCGAALLLAARFHNFNRTINDIIRVVNISEQVIRRRLEEFSVTPTSSLTLDDFQTVDLEDECDPPAYNDAKNKIKRKLDLSIDEEKLDEMRSDLLAAEREIEKELEKKLKKRHSSQIVVDTESLLSEKSANKAKKSFVMPSLGLVDQDADSNVLDNEEFAQSQEFLNKEVLKVLITSTNKEESNEKKEQREKIAEQQTPLSKFETYRPTLESLGISTAASCSFAGVSAIVPDKPLNGGELDLDGISDDEIDRYLLRGEEIEIKRRLWEIHNEPYVVEMARKKAQREEEQKLLESQGLVTKKRRAPRSRKQNAAVGGQGSTSTNQPAASFGEALEKIVQEKKLSSKINYDVLKALSDDTTPKI